MQLRWSPSNCFQWKNVLTKTASKLRIHSNTLRIQICQICVDQINYFRLYIYFLITIQNMHMHNFRNTFLLLFLVSWAFTANAQNEKIIQFYETEVGRGYNNVSAEFAFLNNSILIFQMSSEDHGRELWRTDGTEEGTYLIKDILPGTDSFDSPLSSDPNYFYSMGDQVYFRASDGVHGLELWKTDGTENGTVMVKDIFSGGQSSIGTAPYFCRLNNELFFAAKSSYELGTELWKTDGTAEGTAMVKNINTNDKNSSWPHNLVSLNNQLFFIADPEYNKSEIWYSNGTTEGTQRLSNSALSETPRPYKMQVVNNHIIFSARLSTGVTTLWSTDGSTTNTFKISDVEPFDLDIVTTLDNYIYFKGGDDTHGYELWKTNGTTEGTTLVKDIDSGSESSSPYAFAIFNDKVFFRADTDEYGKELWESDGTTAGTKLCADIKTGWQSSNPNNLTVYNNRLFFTAYHPTLYSVERLFSIGKTPNETPVIHDPLDFSFGSEVYFARLYVVNNKLCFIAELEENTGFEFYRLNNTTTAIKNINEHKTIKPYPNPASEIINLTINESEFTVNIYNMSGQLMASINNTQAINISGLQPGIYNVRILGTTANYSTRFVKK